jgi:hypothetical protein
MNAEELKSRCIEASQFYYKYLEDNHKGIERINISSKRLINAETNTWELHIGKKLFNPDYIKIYNRQFDEYYDLAHFSIREYDADNKLLIIEFVTQTNFSDTLSNNLNIISDLKFLIKNVENWYTDNGQKIQIDNKTKIDKCGCEFQQPELNVNQIQAFSNILSSIYNYIWGPPGTGKTRYVLRSVVLHYLVSDKPKIGIFAPTNNALEQALSSIIEHLDRLEIPREILLRVGGPSRKFAEKYPETCEIQGLEKQLKELERQINNIQNVMEYRRGKHVFGSVFDIQKDIQKITDLNKQWRELSVSKSQKKNELAELIRESKSLTRQLKRMFNIDKADYQSLISSKENELTEIRNKMGQINAEVNQCFSSITNVETRSERIKQIIEPINIQNYLAIAEQLKEVSREINDYLSVNAALAQTYSDYDDERLNELLTQYENDYEILKAMRIEERINNCSIIGMTLDSYIGRFSDVQINFTSIFLDEAGYAPLIKAMTLFSNRCGITLLGDHKQLPPVCEFDNINDIPGFCRLLWVKPSIFSEIVLDHDEEYCLNSAENNDCPEFKYTKKTMLTESHRFGVNLCDLLDKLIYNIGYNSALDDDVELYFIDAPNPIVRDRRKNVNECEEISKILAGNFIDKDYCILTPYRDQVALLQQNLQNARMEERILTIHASQGREWDTVILSVVDGSTIGPWFTNSNDPASQGMYILNTAISRARKKLIIVCDLNYWLSKQDAERQLISSLIKISEGFI